MDGNDSVAMYIFNFTNDDGWVILCNDMRLEPILAYNNSGTFLGIDTFPSGLLMWIEATLERIEYIRDNNITFSTAELAWLDLFEDWGDTDSIESQMMDVWTRYGVVYQGKGSPCYGVTGTTVVKGTIMSTTWGQGCTYNTDVPTSCSNRCSKAPTGCVATATGQIMKYHGHPSADFDFANMNLTSGDADVAELLEDIGDEVDMDYSCAGSGAYSSDARTALDDTYTYNNPQFDDYDLNDVISDLDNHNPVYLGGCRTETTTWLGFTKYEDCHAWVTDARSYVTKPCTGLTYKHMLHMNWGWHEVNASTLLQVGNDYNGWYQMHDWEIEAVNLNYQFANDMIYDIET